MFYVQSSIELLYIINHYYYYILNHICKDKLIVMQFCITSMPWWLLKITWSLKVVVKSISESIGNQGRYIICSRWVASNVWSENVIFILIVCSVVLALCRLNVYWVRRSCTVETGDWRSVFTHTAFFSPRISSKETASQRPYCVPLAETQLTRPLARSVCLSFYVQTLMFTLIQPCIHVNALRYTSPS